jgi:hypothetical protein
MKATKLLAAAAALALGSAAEAVTIDYVSTGSGSNTLFAGQVQETHISLLGCPEGGFIFSCKNDPDVTKDVPLSVFTHAVRLDKIGQNDGGFTGPSATFDIDTVFTVDGHSVTLTQEFNLKQIFNNQFQVSWGASATKTVDLGAAGLLDLTATAGAFQYQGGTPGGGGGSPMRTTFLLRAPAVAPVPEPASWALMIAGFGLAGAALRQRSKIALA